MNHARASLIGRLASAVFVLCLLPSTLAAQEKRTLTFVDLMKFRQVENASLSEDGGWIAFTAADSRDLVRAAAFL